MLKKSLILCGVLVALVNCSSDNDKKVVQTQPSDTTTEIVDDKGKVVDVIQPEQDQKPALKIPTTDELTKKTWTDLGFTKQFLMEELMGGDICSLGEKQYVGCFFAAKTLVPTLFGEGTTLIVKGQSNTEFVGDKVKDFGPFAVHKVPASDIDAKDLVGRSALRKRENDFFKETVSAVIAEYKSRIAVNPLAQKVVQNYKETFPATLKKIEQAHANKDGEAYEKAAQELRALAKDIAQTKTKLEQTLYKDYMAIIDGAFEAVPETDRALLASEVYGEYLTHSTDGHARITLHDALLGEIARQAPQEQMFGIGVSITGTEEGIFMEPLEGSQAQISGVKANDRVVSVNGVIPKDMPEASNMIRGPRHTEEKPSLVTIVVERWDTKKQETLVIKRQPIVQKSYTFSKKSVGEKSYGVIEIKTFMDGEMADAVRAFVSQNDSSVDGWIMDLRGNPGGLLTQAVDLLSVFLPQKSATVAQSATDNPDEMDMSKMMFTESPQVTDKNLVVLINNRSASASEVVAGVLQEYKRALIAGQQSFGKGTVQRSGHRYHPDIPEYEIWDQFSDVVVGPMGASEQPMIVFWKTIGRYFYPSGRTPEWVGVTPDIKVLPNPDAVEMFTPREQDLIPFSFGNLGATWEQTRADLVSKVETCVSAQGESVKTWSGVESKKPFVVNYQMLYAFDALKCM